MTHDSEPVFTDTAITLQGKDLFMSTKEDGVESVFQNAQTIRAVGMTEKPQISLVSSYLKMLERHSWTPVNE